MKQVSLGLNLSTKKTRKRAFLDEMERVVPWSALVQIIEPHWPRAKTGRPPFTIESMLRIHYMQQWFGLSDPAMEEALHDVPMYMEFAGLDVGASRVPDERTILRFRHLLEKHSLAVDMLRVVNDILEAKGPMLRSGTAVDATLIAAPSSTKNDSGECDPEMKQTKKGNQWYFGMKAHIGVDADSGLGHSVVGTAANVNGVTQAGALLHGQEKAASAMPATKAFISGPRRLRQPGMSRCDLASASVLICDSSGPGCSMKPSIRAKVEHPFRVLKQQFGYTKVRYRGLAKNTAQIQTLFMLSNLWMARRNLLASA